MAEIYENGPVAVTFDWYNDIKKTALENKIY